MVKSYEKHGPTQAFGLICSPGANSIYDGKLAYVPALEDILVWDVKKGEMLSMWHETGMRSEVTCVIRSPQKDTFAVGYADGSIRLWSAETGRSTVTFNGHKKAVTALAFDSIGTHLASGSQDTDLILWDVVAETGLFRLRGHRDQITGIRFILPNGPSTSTATTLGYVLTSSKDTFLKLWDLSTQHCVQTVVAHRSEIWSFDVDTEDQLVFTGSGEGEVKAWRIDHDALSVGLKEDETGQPNKMVHPVASLPISARHKVSQIMFHPTRPYLAIQSSDRSVELFRIRTDDEVKKKQQRRKKRAKEKKEKNKGKGKEEEEDVEEAVEEKDLELVDLFTPYLVIRSNGKIRSFYFSQEDGGDKGSTQILLALNSNAIEVHSIPPPPASKKKQPEPEASKLYSVDLPGHRTDIRSLCLSSGDELLASASNGSLKLWNTRTNSCIRTLECGYAICSLFLPGDRHIAVGTKGGEIMIYDIASSSLVETIKAHEDSLWSMHLRPDHKVLVTGSADKDIKFWELEEKRIEGEGNRKAPTLVHVKTLKMTDDILAVKYSPNGKFLAVALLDSTVKVFYQDTLKFFLSLYGHKLPVLSLDISSDSKLIITCSADKNIKIWGLDFGDCHKSIFAHDESVLQVAFEPKTHYFWSVSKDKLLKYWDGDKFELIQKLDGHHGEIWALAVGHSGKFVVTGSHDKSIRIWEKLDEPLFLEEERERELETLYESGIADSMNREEARGAQQEGEEGITGAEATSVHKHTTDTLMGGEKIMEALAIADEDRELMSQYQKAVEDGEGPPPPARNAILQAYDVNAEEYVLMVVQKISNAAMHDALLVLPFSNVISLMWYLNEWAMKDKSIALISQILFFVLRTHHHQIVVNKTMRTILIPLRKHLRESLTRQKEVISYNLAALQFIRRQDDAQKTAQFYEQEGGVVDEEKMRTKIGEAKKRKHVRI